MEDGETPDEWMLAEAARVVRERKPSAKWQDLWRVLFDAWAGRGLPDRAEVYRLMLTALEESIPTGQPVTLHAVRDACWRMSDVVYRWAESPLMLHLAEQRDTRIETTDSDVANEPDSTTQWPSPTKMLPAVEFLTKVQPSVAATCFDHGQQSRHGTQAPRAAAARAQSLWAQVRASQTAPPRDRNVRSPAPATGWSPSATPRPQPTSQHGLRADPEPGPAPEPPRFVPEAPRAYAELRLRRQQAPETGEQLMNNILLQSRKLSLQEVADYVKAVHKSLPNQQH